MNLKRDASISANMLCDKIDCFNVIVRRYITGFIKRIQTSENAIVKMLTNSFYYIYSALYKKWCYLVF